jgi:dihydroflavonol-4-reductase
MLLKQGYRVNAFIEESSPASTLSELKVELFRGDICRQEDMEKPLQKSEIVIHAAASTAIWPNRSKKVWEVNYDAVTGLVSLCRREGIKKMIHIGSANSFGFGTREVPGDETRPYTCARFGLDYQDSKRAIQERLIEEYAKDGFPVTIINPTFMLGPYGSMNGSNKMILSVYRREIPGYSPGGRNYVDVRDVATAVVNSIQMGKPGECYITGNANLSYKEAFRQMADALNVKPPGLPLPALVTLTYGGINSALSSLTGRPPKVSYAMARIANSGYYYSSSKAIAELNMPQTPLSVTVHDTIEYFRKTDQIS